MTTRNTVHDSKCSSQKNIQKMTEQAKKRVIQFSNLLYKNKDFSYYNIRYFPYALIRCF